MKKGKSEEKEFLNAWKRWIKPQIIHEWQDGCKHQRGDHDWCERCRKKMNDLISKMFD